MKKFILTEIDGQWTIEQMTLESVFPNTIKTSDYEVIARLAQLLSIKQPVFPQSFPENVGIGDEEG